jgi:hypothetical protein
METVTKAQIKAFADRFGYNSANIVPVMDALVQNSVGGENPLYCYHVRVNGTKKKSDVYSIHSEPKEGCIESKDIDPKFTFSAGGVLV